MKSDRLPVEDFLEPVRVLLPDVTLQDLSRGRYRHPRRSCIRRASRSPTS